MPLSFGKGSRAALIRHVGELEGATREQQGAAKEHCLNTEGGACSGSLEFGYSCPVLLQIRLSQRLLPSSHEKSKV